MCFFSPDWTLVEDVWLHPGTECKISNVLFFLFYRWEPEIKGAPSSAAEAVSTLPISPCPYRSIYFHLLQPAFLCLRTFPISVAGKCWGELSALWSSPQPMIDGRWHINTPGSLISGDGTTGCPLLWRPVSLVQWSSSVSLLPWTGAGMHPLLFASPSLVHFLMPLPVFPSPPK